MAYFTEEYLEFFKELAANNHRDWFHENKKRYEQHVKAPFAHFVAEMIDRLKKRDPAITLTPKEAIFRINRDIRFSKDKTPYKLHMSAVVSPGGRKDKSIPGGMYFQMSPEDTRVYGGAYMPDREQLQKIRSAIVHQPDRFKKLLKDKKFVEKFGQIHGDENKRLPKEFVDPAKEQPLLFKKSFYFYATFEPEIILREDLPDLFMDYYEAGRPLADFLAKAVK